LREIAGDSGLALRSIQDELKRLLALGLITSSSKGVHRFFWANREHPLFRELVRTAEMSERLPETATRAFVRPSQLGKRATRPKLEKGRSNRPPSWGIFSPTRRTEL
jgi:hypothetical protein